MGVVSGGGRLAVDPADSGRGPPPFTYGESGSSPCPRPATGGVPVAGRSLLRRPELPC
jgi:hypothetical protein